MRKLSKKRKLEILSRTKELVTQPYSWVKGKYHGTRTDKDGNVIETFCLMGAAEIAFKEITRNKKVNYSLLQEELSLKALAKAKGFPFVEDFNDRRGVKKKDILDLIDERIAQLEAE